MPGMRNRCCEPTALGFASSLCNLLSSEGAACSCLLDSGLRPGSVSLYTGDSKRKARQPRGARKGPGAIGAKLRLALLAAAEERWAPPPLRPVAGAAASPGFAI